MRSTGRPRGSQRTTRRRGLHHAVPCQADDRTRLRERLTRVIHLHHDADTMLASELDNVSDVADRVALCSGSVSHPRDEVRAVALAVRRVGAAQRQERTRGAVEGEALAVDDVPVDHVDLGKGQRGDNVLRDRGRLKHALRQCSPPAHLERRHRLEMTARVDEQLMSGASSFLRAGARRADAAPRTSRCAKRGASLTVHGAMLM
jgi:hypothetical protein